MKPVIGISACLLGQAVRYDGASKPDRFIINELASVAELIPVCPEVAIGLGVPRAKIEVVKTAGRARILGVEDRSLDVTDALADFASRFLFENPKLAGLVLKSRSPSCGVKNAPLLDMAGVEIGLTSGQFAASIMAMRPDLPIINETGIPEHFFRFFRDCEAYGAKLA